MATVSATIKIDESLKKDSQKLFAAMGLTLSSAITIFFSQAVRDQGLPFKPTLRTNSHPLSDELLSIIKEAHEGINMSNSFDTVDELMRDLDA